MQSSTAPSKSQSINRKIQRIVLWRILIGRRAWGRHSGTNLIVEKGDAFGDCVQPEAQLIGITICKLLLEQGSDVLHHHLQSVRSHI